MFPDVPVEKAQLEANQALLREISELRERLQECEATLCAIRNGEVDAVVAAGPDGDQVYTLRGADEAYRTMVEGMAQGALTLTREGLVLFANEQFAKLTHRPLDRVIGANFQSFVTTEDADLLSGLLLGHANSAEVRLATGAAGLVPAYLSVKTLRLNDADCLCVIVTDLSEQRRNEVAAAAEKRARFILEQVQAVVISTDLEGKIARWNRGATRLFGYRTREALGQPISLIGIPGEVDPLNAWKDVITAPRGFRELELRVRAKSGEERYIRVALSLLKDDSAGPYAVIGLAVDITAQKAQEKKLQESEARYRVLTEAMPQMVYVTDASGKTLMVNSHWQEYSGLSPEESLNPNWPSFIHREDAPGLMANWTKALASGEDYEHEYRLRNKDGEYRWHLSRAIAVRSQDGPIVNWVGTSTNIHDRKLHEDAIREKEDFLRTIFESSPDCLKVLDTDGRLIDMNTSGRCLMEIDDFGAIRGSNWAGLWGADAGKCAEALERAKTGQVGRFQAPCATGKGKLKQWDVQASAVKDASGRVLRFVVSSRDITVERERDAALRASEETLRQHAAALARANADLLHFAYAVSHDLQAPLRTVTMFAQILDLKFRPVLEEKGSHLINGIVAGSSRMGIMLRDLLRFAEVAGTDPANAEVLLEETLQIALQVLGGSIQDSGAEITHDPLPTVHGDAGQFAQIFQNLIGNSIKYRKPGTPPVIHIASERKGAEWVVTVRDNGIGFDPEYAERIFGVFQRLHSTEFAGTGIGLTICKRIVERHGGLIWAESTQGEGAKFSFSIPAGGPVMRSRSADLPAVPLINSPPVPQSPTEPPVMDEIFHTLDLAQALIRDMRGKILAWTKGAERLFGFSQGEALGRNSATLLRKQFPKPWVEIEAELLRSGEWTGEIHATTKDGRSIWLASHFSLYRDGSGRPQSVVEVHNGIDELKEAEAALRRSQEALENSNAVAEARLAEIEILYTYAPVGLVFFDKDLRYARINEHLAGIHGVPVTDHIGRTLAEVIPELAPVLEPQLRRVIKTRQPIVEEEVHGSISGSKSESTWRHSYYPFVSAEGNVIGLHGVVQDITAPKRAELDKQFLLDLSSKLTEVASPQQLVELATSALGAYMGARCTCVEVDLAGQTFTFLHDFNPGVQSASGTYSFDGFAQREELAANRVVLSEDLMTDPRTASQYASSYLPLDVRANLNVPLHRNGVWCGVIGAVDRNVRIWQEREINLVRGVAERLWPALENARLLLALNEGKEALENSNALAVARLSEIEAIYLNAPVGLVSFDKDLRCVRINEHLARIDGIPVADHIGRTPAEVIPEIASVLVPQLRRVMETRQPILEWEVRGTTPGSPDGVSTWLTSYYPLISADGKVVGLHGVVQDITSRKAAEQAWLESAERLQIATSAAELGVVSWDIRNGRMHWENQRMFEIFGRSRAQGPLSREEFLASSIHPDDLELLVAKYKRDLSTGTRLKTEPCRIRRADGAIRWIQFHAQADRAADGSPLSLVGVVADVTDEVEAQRVLVDERRHLRTLLDSVNVYIGVLSPEGILLESNRAPLEPAGIRPEEVIGQYLPDTFWWSYSTEVRAQIEAAIRKAQSGESSRFDVKARMRDGQLMTLDWAISPLRDEHGVIKYLVPSAVPIEDRKRIESLLATQKEVLERAALDAPLEDILRVVARAAQQHIGEGSGASVFLREPDGVHVRVAAAEGFSEAYTRALDHFSMGEHSPSSGPETCKTIIVADGGNDSRWQPFISLAKEHDIAAIWSQQLRTAGGKVMGTLAMYHRTPREPGPGELEAIKLLGQTTALVIERNQEMEQRRGAEAAVRESAKRSESMLDSIDQLAWTAHADGYIVWYNRRWYEYTGATAEQMEGWGWQSVHDPEKLPEVMERWTSAIKTGEPFDMEFPLRGADGVFRAFLTRVQPLRNSEGNVVQWFGTNTNIEALRQARDVLEDSERKFRELAERLSDLVWVANQEGKLIYCNRQWEAYTGMSSQESVARGTSAPMHPDDESRAWKNWREAMASGERFEVEARLRRFDGSYRWFLNRAEAVIGVNGTIEKWLGTSTDIHELKLTEQALRRSNADLEQFVYAANHDLQEPLRTIAICTQLLEKTYRDKGDEAERFMKYIVNGTRRMDRLLKGIREYSRAGDSNDNIAIVDSEAVVQMVLRNLEAEIAERGATITRGVLPEVQFPESQLSQLLKNLIGNALKYRAKRPLQIEISAAHEGAWQKFRVADNGIGIRAEYLEQIFGVFKRLHNDEFPGVGIGLAVCKKLVERHGGRIWVESEIDQGSTFYFTIPAKEGRVLSNTR